MRAKPALPLGGYSTVQQKTSWHRAVHRETARQAPPTRVVTSPTRGHAALRDLHQGRRPCGPGRLLLEIELDVADPAPGRLVRDELPSKGVCKLRPWRLNPSQEGVTPAPHRPAEVIKHEQMQTCPGRAVCWLGNPGALVQSFPTTSTSHNKPRCCCAVTMSRGLKFVPIHPGSKPWLCFIWPQRPLLPGLQT